MVYAFTHTSVCTVFGWATCPFTMLLEELLHPLFLDAACVDGSDDSLFLMAFFSFFSLLSPNKYKYAIFFSILILVLILFFLIFFNPFIEVLIVFNLVL